MSKSKRFFGVLYIRGMRSEKCTSCGGATTRLVGIGQMRVCLGCATNVMSAINDTITRHADESRQELAKKGGQDASAASRTDA